MTTAEPLAEAAHAKLNLALHVRAREADGYHRIETLFAFCADGDRLTATPAEALTLAIGGEFAEGLGTGADNLVIRAAEALRAACGVTAGAALHLDKRLPVASGIGGGSADAAAALRLLPRLWGIAPPPPLLDRIARGLGADVPACLASRALRGDGRGDDLAPIDAAALAGAAVLLVNPRLPLSTGAVFAGWDGRDRGQLASGDPLGAARAGRNDLEAPARVLQPAVGAVLAWLAARDGAIFTRMSGSGATCFALFESAAARDTAAAGLRRERPQYWCLATTLI